MEYCAGSAECYIGFQLRMVLPLGFQARVFISSLFCTVAILIPGTSFEAKSIGLLVCSIFAYCAFYVFSIVWALGQLKFVDDNPFQYLHKNKSDFSFNRYHIMRTRLMFIDRLFDIGAVTLFVLYCKTSAPHWPACLGIFYSLHAISFSLYSNTKCWKCYAVRTVIPLIISGFICPVVLFVPLMLNATYTVIYLILSPTMYILAFLLK